MKPIPALGIKPTACVRVQTSAWAWIALCLAGHAQAAQWQFDPALLRGSGISAQMAQRFNKAHALLPGTYSMELYVNEHFITQMDVRFIETPDGEVTPCLTSEQWVKAGVDPAQIEEAQDDCPALNAQVAGSSYRLDSGRLRLYLSVAQIFMQKRQRGAVPLDALDQGASLAFFNYAGNVWHAQRNGAYARGHQETGYLSLAGGVNLGLWQYRQQGHLSLSSQQSAHWHNQRSHVQRPLPGLWGGSYLQLGQLSSSGQAFSGVSYHGLSLVSDLRRLPDQQHGFAPVVRGVAGSNAKVSIRQKGRLIYETTVAPGAFVIDDVSPTSHNGDLEVTIEEADGTLSQFSVPFAALPESLRPGQSRYALAAGRTHGHRHDRVFTDASYRRGVSNQISAGGGVRVASGYQALAADAVHLSRIGAVGVNLNYSRAHVPDAGVRSGWMAGVSYSRSFAPTKTHVAIAAYRYSTAGYRELGDILGARFAGMAGRPRETDNQQPRSRLDVSVSQPLGEAGHVFVSGSAQNWRNTQWHDRQWQLGYSTSWHGASLNLSLMRQYVAQWSPVGGVRQTGARDTQFNLSLAMPLGRDSRHRLSQGYRHGRDGRQQYDADVSGHLDNGLSYQLGVNHNRGRGQAHTALHGGLQKRLPSANVGVNASHGPGYWQMGGNFQGALVAHGGGLTFGPWLGDTFALVEAKGARGAHLNGGARIDRHGYALMPSLSPYRDNRILLDLQGAADTLELETGEVHAAPYPGAAVKLKFKVRNGQALLIHVNAPDGKALPLGSEAFDAEDHAVGMLGQGNWLYLRSEVLRGRLQLRWGEGADARCLLEYDASAQADASLIRLQADCVRETDF